MNNTTKKQTLPRVFLHPASIKFLSLGHPWVTKDSYTQKFPKEAEFLVGKNKNGRELAILINDPTHPQIKARLFATLKENQRAETYIHEFPKELSERILKTIKRIRPVIETGERENIYLVFGEASGLPGLFILKLGKVILVQSYISFWDKRIKQISKILISQKENLDFNFMWWQKRAGITKDKKVKLKCLLGEGQKSWVINEFGINYRVTLGAYYDFGLYTDMAAIRKKLTPYFKDSKKVLNLYAYTGAFSLFALKHHATEVVSVDLSPLYLKWLGNNLKLNPELLENDKNHKGILAGSEKAIKDFIKEQKSFDLIICDPPSSSNDGKKIVSAFENYKNLLPKLCEITHEKGHTIIFINTHKITRKKFLEKIIQIIETQKLPFKIVEEISLLEDCPVLKHFPEGDYLKGLALQKTFPT